MFNQSHLGWLAVWLLRKEKGTGTFNIRILTGSHLCDRSYHALREPRRRNLLPCHEPRQWSPLHRSSGRVFGSIESIKP